MFEAEIGFYMKGILSDLEEAWSLLRQSIVELPSSEHQQRLLFHVDEAISWDRVRDLVSMSPLLHLIRHMIQQSDAEIPNGVREKLEDLQVIFDEALGCLVESSERGVGHGDLSF